MPCLKPECNAQLIFGKVRERVTRLDRAKKIGVCNARIEFAIDARIAQCERQTVGCILRQISGEQCLQPTYCGCIAVKRITDHAIAARRRSALAQQIIVVTHKCNEFGRQTAVLESRAQLIVNRDFFLDTRRVRRRCKTFVYATNDAKCRRGLIANAYTWKPDLRSILAAVAEIPRCAIFIAHSVLIDILETNTGG